MFEMNKKILNDYTIKEIYMNFPLFEEKFSSVINAQEFSVLSDSTDNEFYSKLKFVKALNEYKDSLYSIPYMRESADGMIDKILDSVDSVETLEADKNLVYDPGLGELVFNKNSTQTLIFDDLMEQFTEIALKDVQTKCKCRLGNSNFECEGFDKARIEYIGNKVKNIRRNKQYTDGYTETQNQKNSNMKIFERLIKIFGEEKILTLSSSNMQAFTKELFEYGVDNESFMRNLNAINDTDLLGYRYSAMSGINRDLEFMEKIHKETLAYNKENSKKAIGQIKAFKKILDLNEDIPQELREKMYDNLLKSVKDFEYIDFDDGSWAGRYHDDELKVSLRRNSTENVDAKYETILHELMHAATTSRNKIGYIQKVGLHKKVGSPARKRWLWIK